MTEEVAAMVAYFADPEPANITGTISGAAAVSPT
jgi:hypothetical protein